MRIWIVNHYALPPDASGGGPTRHLGIARALRDRGHEVTVVASLFDHYARHDHRTRSEAPVQLEDLDGIRYAWIPTPPYGGAARRVVNMVDFTRRAATAGSRIPGPPPEVVVGSSPHLLAPVAASAIARRHRAAFVLEIRDLWPQSLVDLGELSSRNPAVVALSVLERHLYRTADQVVTVLPAATDHFVARGVPLQRLHVVPNGVELVEAPPRPPSDGNTFTAVYAGTMGLANGLDLVVDAAVELERRGRSDVRIRLVGSGPEREQLRSRAAGTRIVSVEDAIPSGQVPALLAQADAGLLVLRDSPVFRWGISPTKLFDYLSAELPVVSSVRAPSDVASDIGAGIRAEPGSAVALADALSEMAALDPHQRRCMGRRGRRFIEKHHAFPVLAERLETVCREASENPRKDRA